MEKTYEVFSPEETCRLGEEIGRSARPGDIYALSGDLGCGKTVFAKGVAKGLDIKEAISSPTFTILKEYHEGRLPLYHFDVYRIGDPDEMDEIGYEDCFFGEGVSLVEWAEYIEELMPEETIYIKLEKDTSKGFDYRRITINESDSH